MKGIKIYMQLHKNEKKATERFIKAEIILFKRIELK